MEARNWLLDIPDDVFSYIHSQFLYKKDRMMLDWSFTQTVHREITEKELDDAREAQRECEEDEREYWGSYDRNQNYFVCRYECRYEGIDYSLYDNIYYKRNHKKEWYKQARMCS